MNAELSLPKGGTHYYVRLVANNGLFPGADTEVFSPAPNPDFTTLPVDPPTIPGAVEASPVFSTSARVSSTVTRPANEDPAFDVSCRFEYITDAEYGVERSEVQELTVAATGGSFQLEFEGEKSAQIAFDASAATVETALEELSGFPTGDVAVSGGPGDENASNPYVISFAGSLSKQNVSLIRSDGAELEGATTAINLSTAVEGRAVGFEGAATAECEQNAIIPEKADEDGEANVSASLSDLNPSTDYRLRLVAENAAPGVVAKEAEGTFTTEPPVPAPVILKLSDADEVSYKTAIVSGEIERPAGEDPALDVSCRFEYITDQRFDENVGNGAPSFDGAEQAYCPEQITSPDSGHPAVSAEVEVELTGLGSGVTYHLRLLAENSGGTVTEESGNPFTTTPGGDSVATIDPDPAVGYTTAQLSGTITPGVLEKDLTHGYSFEYAEAGTENWSGFSNLQLLGIPGDLDPIEVTAELTGLEPDTEYIFRLSIQLEGQIRYFPGPYPAATTRHLAEPSVTLDPVSTFTGTTAHFSGTVDTNAPGGPLDALGKTAYKTEWRFECTPACPGNNLSGTVQGEEGTKEISVDAKGLTAKTSYVVKLVAHNELYSVESASEPFATPLVKPTVKAALGGSDGEGGYTLQGTVNPNNSQITDCKFKWGPNSASLVFSADCSPMPDGHDEVQWFQIKAGDGQFRLSYQGQTTADMPFNASPDLVETELAALSLLGPTSVDVTGGPGGPGITGGPKYEIAFGGSLAQTDVSQIQIESGSVPLSNGGAEVFLVSGTTREGGNSSPVTVEAHLTGLTPGAHYHFNLLATNEAGTEESGIREFVPLLRPAESCPNEQVRSENNSITLPECRAYEKVTPDGKEGFDAGLIDFSGGERVSYQSGAGNIAKSGQNIPFLNFYVAARTSAGWETIPNLNGSSGTLRDGPSYVTNPQFPSAYSPDLLSSLWYVNRIGDPDGLNLYLRQADGTFTLIGLGDGSGFSGLSGVSEDLSHVVMTMASPPHPSEGVYEFVGTGNDQPRRVDVDNSETPICGKADGMMISGDGRVIVVSACGSIWARINGTTSFDVSASHCDRVDCNPSAVSTFQGGAKDGSRVLFTTTQQLVDGDVDQYSDLYACDLPGGNPTPSVEKGNVCSAFRQVSIAGTGAGEAERVFRVSEDGSTVYFAAKGVLALNDDALEEQATAGDHNLYVWRQDAAHPNGHTAFVGRLLGNDGRFQATPDGRYLVFLTAAPLLPTDTDTARDVYRYDADTGKLFRASTAPSGTGGNAGDFDAVIAVSQEQPGGVLRHNPHPAVSADGERIVFTTSEALSAADGNGEPDAYLWTPGGVSLISTGAAGGGVSKGIAGGLLATISASGRDIYFNTTGALTPEDGDDIEDVYDARIGGGFGFAQAVPCPGEACQPPSPEPPAAPAPTTTQTPADPGNVKPRVCPKGKVLKGKRCVRKKHKKHHGKKGAHRRGAEK